MDLHISIEEFFLTKVLQPLWFNEGGSAGYGAITDETSFVRAAGLTGAQTQLLSADKEENNVEDQAKE